MRFLAISANLLVACTFAASPLKAATYVVDPGGGGFSTTIQPAISAAASGDTVLVVAGYYAGPGNTNLDFAGKNLVLLAQDGPEFTTIDGQGSGRVLWFHSGEDTTAVVDGFTMADAPAGGTIRISDGAQPSIRECILRDTHTTVNDGAAVSITNSSPRFLRCRIVENGTSGNGGGVLVQGGSPLFFECTIIGNLAGGEGGGMRIEGIGATTIARCTISGNRADQSAAGSPGGGLSISGLQAVTVHRSIVWGNYANSGEDLQVDASAGITFTCSVVDSGGAGGPGIVYGTGTSFGDPHFCRPGYCQDEAWTNGDYALAANSPCLPAGSPCGQRIGSQGQGCGEVAVWIGGPGSRDWDLAGNWSTGRIPEPGDHVQLTRGHVALHSDSHIDLLTFCPESSVPDTFFIRDGAVLTVGDTLRAGGKPDPSVDKVMVAGVTMVVDGGGIESDPEGSGTGFIVLPGGIVIVLNTFFFQGNNPFVNRGEFLLRPNAQCLLDVEMENFGRQADGRGLFLQQGGSLVLQRNATNFGDIGIGASAVLQVDQTLTNAYGATVTLDGSLAGAGAIDNLGLLVRTLVDPRKRGSTSTVAPALFNRRDDGLGRVGLVQVADGVLGVMGSFQNEGEVEIAAGAGLDLGGTVDNLSAGRIDLAGDLTGSGTLANLGTLTRTGSGTSIILPEILNRFDTATGERGIVQISSDTLVVNQLRNRGMVVIGAGTTLGVELQLENLALGEVKGAGMLENLGTPLVNFGVLRPGFSPGALGYTRQLAGAPSGRLLLEIGGREPGTGYDQLNVQGLVQYGGTIHVDLVDGFFPVAGDTFTVVTVGTGGAKGEPPVAGTDQVPAFDCISGIQLPGDLFLEPVELADRLLLVARDTTLDNVSPVAVPDTVFTWWSAPVTIQPLENDNDADGDELRLAILRTGSAAGVAILDSGATTVTYVPPVEFVGTDSFRYVATDCRGATDSALVVVEVGDLSAVPGWEPPATARLFPCAPNPFNPVTRIRYDLATAGPARVVVYDLRGRRVRTLAEGHHEAGTHVRDWWGRDDRGRAVAAGVYMLRLETPGWSATRKTALIR
jgi:hypothetical protein